MQHEIDTYSVSVIVPIYNMEKYLGRCVDSILAQTFENLQILLVDDGSTDGSSLLCDELAESHYIRSNRGPVTHQFDTVIPDRVV